MPTLDELIAQLKQVQADLALKSSISADAEIEKLESDIQRLNLDIIWISRFIHNIPFATSKDGRRFTRIDNQKILHDMGAGIDHIINRFEHADSQLICGNLSHVFHQPETFAVKMYNYILNDEKRFPVLCKITFPALFGYFSTMEFCCNAASMIMKFSAICKNEQYVYQLAETFLISQYSFYESLWTRFIKKIKLKQNEADVSNSIFNALSESLNQTVILIEIPFHQVILEILRLFPISSSTSFLLNTMIYKTGKLFLKYHRMCLDFKFKQIVLNTLKRYVKEPCSIEANQIIEILSEENPSLFNLPSLIDEGHMISLPLVLSDYEAIEYCKIVVPPRILKNSFINCKSENEIRKMLFLPFKVQLFSNKQHFRKKESDFFIRPYKLFPIKNYLTEEQISTFEFQWQQENTFETHFHNKSKEYEFYSIYKTIEKMNQEIDKLNHAITLSTQYKLMQKQYNILEIYHNLIITKFCEKTEPFPILKMRPNEYCIKYLNLIRTLNYKNTKLKVPYIVHLLNHIPIKSIIGFEITDNFQRILESLSNTKNKNNNEIENIKKLPFLIISLVFEEDSKLGDRFQILFNYIESVSNVASYQNIDDISTLHKILINSSQNQYLLETVLLIEKFLFQNKDFSIEIDVVIRKRWFSFFQTLLLIITDDPNFVLKCSSILK